MFAYTLQHFCCYFTLKEYNKGYIHYLQYNRAINTTYNTRQLLHPTYYKESILNNFTYVTTIQVLSKSHIIYSSN